MLGNIIRFDTFQDEKKQQNELLTSLHSIVAQLPGMIYFKNSDFAYFAATTQAATLLGFKDVADLCGHTDYELRCPVVEGADDFRALDKRVIATGEIISSLQVHTYHDGNVHIYLVKKAPIKDSNGTIIGVSCVSDEVSSPAMGQAVYNLISLGKTNQQNLKLNQLTLEVNTHSSMSKLTPRESELIFYFVRGFTIKQIALLMTLSPRTVESYLETIRHKFNCQTKNELSTYCLKSGYSNIISHSILQRCVNTSILL